MSIRTSTELLVSGTLPLDLPYPLDGVSPRPSTGPKDRSSPPAILDFLLATTGKDAQSLKTHALRMQKEAYTTRGAPCIRAWSWLKWDGTDGAVDTR